MRSLTESVFPAFAIVPLCVLAFACGEASEQEAAPEPVPEVDSELSPAPDPEPVEAEAPWLRPADGMEMVRIPAGEFTMGDDGSPYPAERPTHTVSLDEYWIDRTEISNLQFRGCVEAGACVEPGPWSDPNLNGDDQPVLAPWESALAYCGWASMRLPTEAEWEKAARGLDGRLWPWGNEYQEGLANLSGEGDGYMHTAPVGAYPSGASPYGVLDMAGNATEWVADWHADDFYQRSPGANPAGPSSGEQRVYRSTIAHGGGGPEKSRTVARYSAPPRWDQGFRCATSALPETEEGGGN